MCIMFAALSLTVLYSIRNQLIVASAKPTTVAEWRNSAPSTRTCDAAAVRRPPC